MSHLVELLVLAAISCSCLASLTAVSNIKACTNDGSGSLLAKNGSSCRKKLTVAMTVEANEGKSQYLEAQIRRVHDATSNQNLHLKTPVTIKITKSPVLIQYRLYQVGYVNHNPYEEVVNKKNGWCRDDWYSEEHEAACGFKYRGSEKIFDSQGFCCPCDMHDQKYDRAESKSCLGHRAMDVAHCLRFDHLYDYVFGLYPPQLVFTITINIEKVTYTRKNGEQITEKLDTLVLSPFQRVKSSKDKSIRAEYIADFHANSYMPVLAHKYLLVPDPKLVDSAPKSWKDKARRSGLLSSVRNPSDWLLVGKERFGMSGLHCNKIGVSYQAFSNQADKCTNVYGSCLQGQPQQLWESDKRKKDGGMKGQYMLHNFGKLHNSYVSSDKKKKTKFQVSFIAQRVRRSLITIRMEADSLKSIINTSPARIVEAYIDSFEALSAEGLLNVILQNTGSLTATYKVFVAHCSAGVDLIPEESVTLDPGVETNVSFTVHSFHALGKINQCEVELCDQTGERLDNMTVFFETHDTCFCHGYCGCSCGNNVTDCPPPPERHSEDEFRPIKFLGPDLKWLKDITGIFNGKLFALLFSSWIVAALIALGVLKVILMIYMGQANCNLCLKIAKGSCSFCCGLISTVCGKCCSCCVKTTTNLAWGAAVIATGKNDTKYVGREAVTAKNARRPINCDGMCRGAKQARRLHRKKLRVLKRRGAKTAKMLAWWEKSYNCTCVVSDTKSIIEIMKGLFFFIYCPLLPLWWLVEFAFEWLKRKRRRSRRMAEFRKKKAIQRARNEKTYLMLDKYTRGTKEMKMFDFEAEMEKNNKKNQKDKAPLDESSGDELGEDLAKSSKTMKELSKEDQLIAAMEEGTLDLLSQDESAEDLGLSASDTTDTDEAGDIDELLNPGFPVYFNYAGVSSKKLPKSLKSPGKSFSIKGRLSEEQSSEANVLMFDLHTCTVQDKQQVKNKVTPVDPPVTLNPKEFKQRVQPDLAQQLVTLAPLFPCLNCEPSTGNKKKRKKKKKK